MKKPPKDKTIGDAAQEIAKTLLSVVPAASGPLTALFDNIFTAPLNKRRQEWLEELAEAVSELQEKIDGLTPDKLAKNEVFITASLQASQIALRNHKKEKLEALRNAIVNSALPDAPDDSLQHMFLNLVDTFTVWHLSILKLFQNPEKWAKEHNHTFPDILAGSLFMIIESAYPQLYGQLDFCLIIWRDLFTNGLINTDNLAGTTSGSGLMKKRTTNVGDKFIRFINKPELSI